MLTIGEIVGVYGLDGALRVFPHTNSPERFAALARVEVLLPNGERRQFKVFGARVHGSRQQVILKLDGVRTPEAAKQLVGGMVEIDDQEALELPAGTYFEHDVLGLQVLTTDGRDLGRITDIVHTGANDVYVTPTCLIPAIGDVVREVDIPGGRVIIEAVPGLLDE